MKTAGRPLLNFFIVFSALVVLPMTVDAALIAISNTFASSEVSTDRAAIHATNGSNLNFTGTSGQEGDPSKYTHTASSTEFGQGSVNWLSKTASAVGASNAGEHWFAVDLGASYLVDTLNFFNFGTNTGTRNTRGTSQADIYYRTDSLGTNSHLDEDPFNSTGWTLFGSAGSQTFTLGPNNGSAAGPDTVNLGGITARYIAFDINTNHGDGSGYAGIGEVQFFGAAVPEPSKVSLFLLAGLLTGLRRRRSAI